MAQAIRTNRTLLILGAVCLAYAMLGNYVALPGYLRFLERGGTSAAGNAMDLDVVIGATKTIVWMYSFQLGVMCFAAAYSIRQGLRTGPLLVAVFVWLSFWSIPALPALGAAFYVVFGALLLLAIPLVLTAGVRDGTDRTQKTMFLGALVIFAFATWEVCGLGTAGRMLHPSEAAAPLAHNILVTQSTKLMIEFVLAWSLLAGSMLLPRVAAR